MFQQYVLDKLLQWVPFFYHPEQKARVLIHQPLGGAQGQATDIEIQANEIIRIKKSLNSILASNTGQPLKKIEKDTDRDYIMTPEEALEYGMIDKVVTVAPQEPKYNQEI